MDSPFWENAIAAQFRHVAGSIGSRVLPHCRNRAAWQASKRWMPPSAACSGLPLALRLHPPSGGSSPSEGTAKQTYRPAILLHPPSGGSSPSEGRGR